MRKCLVVSSLLFLIDTSVNYALEPNASCDDTTPTFELVNDITSGVICSLLFPLLFVLAKVAVHVSYVASDRKASLTCRVCQTNDGVFAKTEFKLMFGIIIGLIIAALFILARYSNSSDIKTGIGLAAQASGLGFLFTSVLFPLALSVRFERLRLKQVAVLDNINGVSDLLQDAAGAAAFLSFTNAEFNSECPLFWLRVRDFRLGILQHSSLVHSEVPSS